MKKYEVQFCYKGVGKGFCFDTTEQRNTFVKNLREVCTAEKDKLPRIIPFFFEIHSEDMTKELLRRAGGVAFHIRDGRIFETTSEMLATKEQVWRLVITSEIFSSFEGEFTGPDRRVGEYMIFYKTN